MYQQTFVVILAVLVCTASSLRIPPAPAPCCGRSLISTLGALTELAYGSESCGCSTSKPCCKESYIDVILPPVAELPCGLGYLPSAAPLVAAAYGCRSACDACVPVTSPCSCTTLATPQCAEMRAFAKPVIL